MTHGNIWMGELIERAGSELVNRRSAVEGKGQTRRKKAKPMCRDRTIVPRLTVLSYACQSVLFKSVINELLFELSSDIKNYRMASGRLRALPLRRQDDSAVGADRLVE